MNAQNQFWLFPTPVFTYDLRDYVTKELQSLVHQSEMDLNTLVDGSRPKLIPHTDQSFNRLFNKIQECINDFSDQIGLRRSTIFESWANILKENGQVGAHRHYGSIISGAFYIEVDPNSAPIYFVSATEGFRMADMQVTASYEKPYTPNIHSIQPYTGQLVLFPSWIEHYVGLNKTAKRVTLSFNTQVK